MYQFSVDNSRFSPAYPQPRRPEKRPEGLRRPAFLRLTSEGLKLAPGPLGGEAKKRLVVVSWLARFRLLGNPGIKSGFAGVRVQAAIQGAESLHAGGREVPCIGWRELVANHVALRIKMD